MSAVLLAADAGLRNFGWCVLRADGFRVECIGAGVVRTEKSNAKRNVLAANDNTRRVRELAHALDGIITSYKPQVLCSESMSFPRNASSACKLGMGRAVLDTIAELRGLPVLEASPQEVKKAIAGRASASKDAVAFEVSERIELDAYLMGLPHGVHEHMFDAAAVGLTCLSSDVVRALRRQLDLPLGAA